MGWEGGKDNDGTMVVCTKICEHTIPGQKYTPVPRDDSYCIKMSLICVDHIYIGFCLRADSSKSIFFAQESQ